MLSSLPPLFPQDVTLSLTHSQPHQANLYQAHSLYYQSLSAHQPPPSSQNPQNPNNVLSRTPAANQYHRTDAPVPIRTALSILRADENMVSIRKANIRGFGAGWLRPLGVGKTLQGMADERAEREEQEGVAARWVPCYISQLFGTEYAILGPSCRNRSQFTNPLSLPRELALAEAQAAAEAEALANGETVDGLDPDDDLAHNLDDDVPDAEEEGGWIDDDEVDEDDEDNNIDDQALADMNDEGEGDYAEQPDLDDDVPEAGSYQHTDTEVEDSSSVEEGFEGRTAFEMAQQAAERNVRLPAVGAGSGVLGSSVFGSSPVVQMSYQGRSQGGVVRGRGREN